MELTANMRILANGNARAYRELSRGIGNTPLVRYRGFVPNHNVIVVKEEFRNPFGSPYDRVYLASFKHGEGVGFIIRGKVHRIRPGDHVLETTSGSAGVSFAGIGGMLGYDCHVVLPEGSEKAREGAILEQLRSADRLHITHGDYVNGFPDEVRRFLHEHRDFVFFNHSMGPDGVENRITVEALRPVGSEICSAMKVNYFIPAVGNGSSILGPALGLSQGVKVIGFESVQAAVMFAMLYPGRYERMFGIKPGTLPRHSLPGTSYNGIAFPHIRAAVDRGLVSDVVLVSDVLTDMQYFELTGRHDTEKLVHWDDELEGCEKYGRTTLAGINVALDLAKRVEGKTIAVIGYDDITRYDSRYPLMGMLRKHFRQPRE